MALVMAQMPDVWRKVLAEHLADPTGRCAACRNANGETASWPCQTYRVAQEAKWVSEGNLPGTGPHGPGVNASPRVSPPSQPFPASGRRPDDGPAGYGYDLPNTGGFGYGAPSGGGFGYDLPSSGGVGYESPGSSGYGYAYDPSPSSGLGYDAPGTGGYGGLESYSARSYDSGIGYGYTDPRADDASTTFGGADGNAPALASLPPLPPSASSTSDSARPRHGSPDYHDAPRYGSAPDPDPLGSYGSPSYASPYSEPSSGPYSGPSSEPDPLSAPSPGFSTGAGFGDGPRFDASPSYGSSPSYGVGDGPGFRPGDGFGSGFGSGVGDGPAHPFAGDPPRRSSWGGDESRPYGSTVDAPYGSTFGVDDRPRGSRR